MRVLSSPELSATIASIKEGATVAISGAGGGLLEPEAVFQHFEASFLERQRPRRLTLVHALGMGNRRDTGTNRFAYEGMVKRVIGGHWIWSPRMLQLSQQNKIEAYCLPSGAITNLFREIGARRPGLFTHVGLGTFATLASEAGVATTSRRKRSSSLCKLTVKTSCATARSLLT